MLLWNWILPALLLTQAQAHIHHRGPETFHVSAGHLVVLPCPPAAQRTNVSWTREGQDLGLGWTLGVEVQDRQLWFRPANTSHSGVYTCHYRSQSVERQAQMKLSVSSEKCPIVADHGVLNLEENGKIPCKIQHIYKASNLSSLKNIRWTKGCTPLHRPGAWVDGRGQLWIPKVTPEDTGTYTCFIDLSVGGDNYTAAWSVEVALSNDTVFMQPHVVYPRDETIPVHLGGSVELRCKAYLGYSESHTMMYWLLNHTHTEDYPEVNYSVSIEHEGRHFWSMSTLIISEVHRELLNISIICCVENTAGQDYGQLWLTQAEPDALLSALAWSLSLSLVLLLLAALLYSCRVELVLACRDLRSRFTKHYVHDGKLYDGVVSCLCPPGVTPPELSLFSLQVLPQHLEGQWGYRLYIPGRDDCPGEALHDALSETVKKSRRLLLLLCASGTQGALSLSEELQPLCFEQRVGLYDALTHKEPRVILIETGGPVVYSHLPESVQYLRRTQGALQWTPAPRGRLSFLLRSERSFWNRLRYYMPPVPSGRGTSGGVVQSKSPTPHSPKEGHMELVESFPSQAMSSARAVPV